MINSTAVNGNLVRMFTTDPLHYSGEAPRRRSSDDVSGSFADMLNSAVTKTNDLQVDSEALMKKMVTEPESVDIHQVMIASQKAELALGLTKAVRDGALNAYRELMNLR
ncbi:MAG TPA: flagellar hook-basal body complex protein FliE [Spirochaetota bacterium]|nr:flagellar hook-basal body complex protein FliE [Spirochaetota bacterium]HPJ33590.1 flagellar hook-basal body complex protein FliE [Spirochaetota bacterium]